VNENDFTGEFGDAAAHRPNSSDGQTFHKLLSIIHCWRFVLCTPVTFVAKVTSKLFSSPRSPHPFLICRSPEAGAPTNKHNMGDLSANQMNNTSSSGKDEFHFDRSISMEQLRQLQDQFARERDWEQFHTPRNLLIALVAEVGELSELFQWRGEVASGIPDWSEADRKALGEELSDVLCYLIRLADRCHIDLPAAAVQKIASNSRKYPADKVRGSSKKYTEYDSNVNEGDK
jgi:dCTP diphosphatase